MPNPAFYRLQKSSLGWTYCKSLVILFYKNRGQFCGANYTRKLEKYGKIDFVMNKIRAERENRL